MFGAILKATDSSFQKGMTFCRSIYVKKVMKLLAFIFEQPSYLERLKILIKNIHTSCLRAAKALTRLHLHIYFHTLYASKEGSAETGHLQRLVWALSACICDKHQSRQHCGSWLCWASSWNSVTFNIFATANAQINLSVCTVPLKLLLLAHHTKYEWR